MVRLRGCDGVVRSRMRAKERTAGGSEGGKQSGSGGLLPCARVVVSGVWSEQSSGAGEFAVFVWLGGGCVRALCVAEWGVGVRERVTRSAVGASDTGR